MSTTIESLELEIQANSKGAVAGIDALTQSLTKLKSAIKGGLGLTAVANELRSFDKVDASEAVTKMETISSAISKLSSLPKSNLSGYITPLKNLPKALEGMNNVDMSNLNSGLVELVESLEPLYDLTKTNLSGYITPLKDLPQAFEGLNSVDMSAFNSSLTTLVKSIEPLKDLSASNISGYITPLKSLPQAFEGLNGIDMSKFNSGLTELVTSLKPLSDLTKTNLPGYISSLKKIPEVMAELNAVDMGAFTAKMQEVATAMKPLATEMEKVSNGFSAMPSKIQKLITATNKMPSSNKKAAGSFTDLYHKIKLGANVIKQFTTKLWSAVEKSMDYTENMNLFTVSMGEYASEAYAYAEKVSDAMGIDTSEWTRAQGVFMTLATGFGVAGDRAATMSKNLTQLSYDLSSFYNMDVEDAMLKVKSGLAGELEPLRAIGYDLSQAKLEATALELGISKSVSAMTQAEKAQLRYYAIMTQVTQTHGDMARTLEDPANQVRVFKAQINMAAREIGNVFIPMLNAIIPYATAIAKVIGYVASNIAGLFGYKDKEVEETTSKVVANTDAVTENLSDAQEEAKKLKSYMLGFDELNVINPNDGDAIDTSGEFDFELPTYDFMEGLAESKVNTIVEEMKEWLGITEDISSWADLFDTKLGKILIAVTAIGGAFVTWKVVSGVSTLITAMGKALGVLKTACAGVSAAIAGVSAPVVAVVAVIAALVAGLTAVYLTNDEVKRSVDAVITSVRDSFVPLITFVTTTVIPGLRTAWESLLTILKPIGDWLAMVFTSIWMDMLVPALQWVADVAVPSVTTVFINFWNNVLVPLGNFLASVFTPIVNMLSEVLTWLWQYVVLPLASAIGEVLSAAWQGLCTIINETVIPVVNGVIQVFQFLWDNVLSPIVTFLWDIFAPAYQEVFQAIGDIIGSIKTIFTGVIDFVTGVFTGNWKKAWQGVVDVFSGIWKTISTVIKTPFNAVISVIEGFINKFIDGWNWLKTQINGLSIEMPDWLGGGTLGFNLKMSDHLSIPRFAEGGFPEQGQMFIAREAGAEMVGNIGRRTAVANNDQIVASISGGVAEANEEQNILLREQNSLLRAILEKDSSVYLDGRNLTNSVEKYQRERGRNILAGGVI